jgi:hypothetical protein
VAVYRFGTRGRNLQNANRHTITGPAESSGSVNCRRFSLNNAGTSRDVVHVEKLKAVYAFPRLLLAARSLADEAMRGSYAGRD